MGMPLSSCSDRKSFNDKLSLSQHSRTSISKSSNLRFRKKQYLEDASNWSNPLSIKPQSAHADLKSKRSSSGGSARKGSITLMHRIALNEFLRNSDDDRAGRASSRSNKTD